MNIWTMRALVLVGRLAVALVAGWFLGAVLAIPFMVLDGAGQMPIVVIPVTIVAVYVLSFWMVPVGGRGAWRRG